MHTLHTRACQIVTSWADEEVNANIEEPQLKAMSNLWSRYWCPLLQGIARQCCDSRRQVRSAAVTYLQRALLVHDLQTLSAVEWETCFNKVLFPLLLKLLENVSPGDPTGLEEIRMRGATLLCKVFLQHLSPLLSLPTFTALFLTILDFMDKYMHADKSDLLCEAIPESLKNMLLVMDTAGIFSSGSGHSQLWTITWDRIDAFLPGLKDEVFRSHQRVEVKSPEPEVALSDPVVETKSCDTEINDNSISSCVVDICDLEEVSVTEGLVDSVSKIASPQPCDSPSIDNQLASSPKAMSVLIDQGQHLHQPLPISVVRVQEQSYCATPAKNIPLVINREIFNSSSPMTVVNQSTDQGSPT
ncbi:G-box binding factor, variant 2 [Chamberlinius hualienensis]